MNNHITSNGQKGGQTAGMIVNNNYPKKPTPWRKKIKYGIYAIGVLLVSIFGYKEGITMFKKDQSTTVVTSNGQSGGQTAGVINNNLNFTQQGNYNNQNLNFVFEKPARTIDKDLENKLKDLISRKKILHISAVVGDSEALEFAQKIKDFYENNGGKIGQLSRFMDSNIDRGWHFMEGDGVNVSLMVAAR